MPISLSESPRGAGRPRVEVVPPHVFSLGAEAVELARRAGLELDPWQQDALRVMLAVREDGKWACFEYGEIVARQNGKGAILEARALAGLFLLGERLIMWSAHEYKTAMEAFLRLRALIRNLEHVGVIPADTVKTCNTNGEESFEIRATGQRLKFIARSKSSGRGFSGDCNLIDESFAYSAIQHAALLPTMSARQNPQIVYTSSPPLDGDSGDVLFALKARAEAGGDDSLGWRDWGPAANLDQLDRLNLDDVALWAATNPAMGVRITEETIRRERRSMGAPEFARERLSVWPRQLIGGGAIDPANWAALMDPESRRDGDVAIGVDIAPDRNYAAIGLYGRRADGYGHMQIVDYRPGTDWLLDRIREWREAVNPVAIAMGRACAASLDVELEKVGITRPEDPEKPRRGDLAVTSAMEMSAACGQFLDGVRQRTERYVPDAANALDASVAGAKVKQNGDTLVWARKESAADTSPLVAVTVARWAWHALSHLVDQNVSAEPTFALL
ncbi:hypothetical protein SAMN05421837_107352 [Amycolatopsis pretoriensis]|uniref:Phage terminase-like protein, large subunit, contains N-terminal HTH domain n=1 Tax=Amycolatopsis pretoriensis TaxID=218821 RepID=A0A1H5R9W6_9PSEU|nr:hypothetical protein SAMN05421837_107352 [Amycolatopsis pretoriensis]